MRAELANLYHCVVLFLSRATVDLSWYDSITYVDRLKFVSFLLLIAQLSRSKCCKMTSCLHFFTPFQHEKKMAILRPKNKLIFTSVTERKISDRSVKSYTEEESKLLLYWVLGTV